MTRTVDGDLLKITGYAKVLQVNTDMDGNAAIMHLAGSVTKDVEEDLADEILALISVRKNIRLDLGKLEYISNSFQTRLAEIQSQYVEKAGIELELFNVPHSMYMQFRSVRLDTQIRIKQEE